MKSFLLQFWPDLFIAAFLGVLVWLALTVVV